jgi:hypothetical protein
LSVSYLTRCLLDQSAAISKCDAHALLVSGNIEDTDVSHFIMQYVVKTDGKLPFEEYSLDFVNKTVTSQVQNKLDKCSLDDRRVALIRNDEVKTFMTEACPKIYESVIADLLTSTDGVKWKTRVAQLTSSESSKSTSNECGWTDFTLKLKRKVLTQPRTFDEMEEMVLYVPQKSNYPFVEFMYKAEGKLVVFQVTRQTQNSKSFKWTAVSDFLMNICIPDARPLDRVRLIFIPLPSNADTANLKASESVVNPDSGTLKEYEVWKVPSSYDSMFD